MKKKYILRLSIFILLINFVFTVTFLTPDVVFYYFLDRDVSGEELSLPEAFEEFYNEIDSNFNKEDAKEIKKNMSDEVERRYDYDFKFRLKKIIFVILNVLSIISIVVIISNAFIKKKKCRRN